MSEHINDTNFNEKITNSKGLTLVDFWAPWCAPCKMVGPEVEKLEKQVGDKLKVYKLNVDENRQTATKFRVMSIPTIMWFKDGKVVESSLGALPFEALYQKTLPLLEE